MHVVIFEGNRWGAFAPLSLGRPIFTLMSGASTLLEKQIRHLKPSRISLWVRPQLAEWTKKYVLPTVKITATVNQPLDDEPVLFMSARQLVLGMYKPLREESIILDDEEGTVRSAYVRIPGLTPEDILTRSKKWMPVFDLPQADSTGRTAQHVWDLLDWNDEALVDDSISFERHVPVKPGPYHVVQEQMIFLGRNVDLDPGCVLDGSKGPIMIADNVGIGSNAVIQGPCYIGANTSVRPLAFIRPGTTIGPNCRVGGEISNSIIQGNSNKSHEGFLGDSYVGEFVNLGAGTNTSNLKNTYGLVTVRIGKHKFETGRRFVGSVIGDHTKTAIGTRLTTGSYVGFGSMVAHSSPPHFIPSFTFLTDRGAEPYRRDKAIEVMQQVRSRRALDWTQVEDNLLDYTVQAAREIEGG